LDHYPVSWVQPDLFIEAHKISGRPLYVLIIVDAEKRSILPCTNHLLLYSTLLSCFVLQGTTELFQASWQSVGQFSGNIWYVQLQWELFMRVL
jgi:hypothetical protein